MSDKPNEVKLQIEMNDEIAQGAYINMGTVSHTETEFVLDLIYVQPQQPRGRVRSRVITSPRHIKRLVAALQDNIRRYEEHFGPIDASGKPDFPMH